MIVCTAKNHDELSDFMDTLYPRTGVQRTIQVTQSAYDAILDEYKDLDLREKLAASGKTLAISHPYIGKGMEGEEVFKLLCK